MCQLLPVRSHIRRAAHSKEVGADEELAYSFKISCELDCIK